MMVYAANAEKGEVEQGLPRDAADLGEVEVLRLEVCGEGGADLVDVDVVGVKCRPDERRKRRGSWK